MQPVATPQDRPDVLIVGGGVAGLYCAWRLLEQQPQRHVVVVERLSRTGGRLESDLITIDNRVVHEEEGGMRFNGQMLELLKLLNAMDLCAHPVPFPMVDQSQGNRRSLRGRSFSVLEAQQGKNAVWSQLYRLNVDEQGRDPLDILSAAFDRIVAANEPPAPIPPVARTPAYWQRLRQDFTWKGVPLKRWQLWGLLRDMGMSEECVTLIAEIAGFEGLLHDYVNAGSALQMLEDFSGVTQFYTMVQGMSRLPDTLAKRVEALGGRISLDTTAVSVSRTDQFAVDLETSGGTRFRVTAPQVVLALPAGPLQTLFAASPALNTGPQASQLCADIAAARGPPLLKTVLYYDHPWWSSDSIVASPFLVGPSFTDLPLNAVYPFLSIEGDPTSGPAALTIYCDFAKVSYWRGLQGVGPRFSSPLQHQYATLTAVSQAIVDAATAQLALLFDSRQIPAPLLTSYRCWSDDNPFGAAYHLWALGADDPAVTERMIEPSPGLFVANEAWSDMQGWVNGSLRSADLVLTRFGITPMAADRSLASCMLPLNPPRPPS